MSDLDELIIYVEEELIVFGEVRVQLHSLVNAHFVAVLSAIEIDVFFHSILYYMREQ